MINVTEPFLPPLEEYTEMLKGIWERKWLTNQGELVKELELKLQDYHRLDAPVFTFANGGLGLQIMLKALGIGGEVITTPFSYVATVSCPLWEGCTVKFADIDPIHLTLDPDAVEAAITPKTEAILATHVYGNPCDVEAFERIGKKYGIAVLYDAAHAFGVNYKGRSLLDWGDASMVSLHATKVFHAVEGGCVVAKDPDVQKKLSWMRRFGHFGIDNFHGVAINAKMCEFHAAMGLVNLNHITDCIHRRKEIVEQYQSAIQSNPDIQPAFKLRDETDWNYSYYPVLFSDKYHLSKYEQKFFDNQIVPRRYFYPTLNTLDFPGSAKNPCAISENIAPRVLCLPLASTMSQSEIDQVINVLSL
jgi:dTDP-4-amino-4,6-dideoxygalactose transaminase